MTDGAQLVLNLLPIVGLFVLGFVLKRIRFVDADAVESLKRLVVNIALPSLLFIAFSTLRLELRLLVVVIAVFMVCSVMVVLGRAIGRLFGITSPYFAILMGGFETGMIGYAIFIAVFGAENVSTLALVDFGQVTFVFFVLVAMLISLKGEKPRAHELLLRLLSSPVIIAIFAGLAIGQLQTVLPFADTRTYATITGFLQLLANLTVPLICIVIGYQLEITRQHLWLPLFTLTIRTALLLGFAFLVSELVLERLLHLPSMYRNAVFTMFVLPPPFVIPLFMKQNDTENLRYVSNTLSLGTLASTVVFAGLSFLVF